MILGIPDDFTGKRVAIRRAWKMPPLSRKDVDVLVANGSGIPQEDIQESSRSILFMHRPSKNFM